jgi:hypothetical protein
LVGCTSQQPDGFLPLRAFKPSFSENADRGRSIIQVNPPLVFCGLLSHVKKNRFVNVCLFFLFIDDFFGFVSALSCFVSIVSRFVSCATIALI